MKRSEKRKYHISLCIMFKDEAPYLREWIEYHRMIGVDHFYMYDNLSSDGFEAVIGPYVEEGVVTLIRWPHEHAQVRGYEDCIRRFQGESDWIGFIDVDEFLVPVEEESLVTFLDRFSRRPSVLVYWRFFGSGGMLRRDVTRLVTEDFVVASEKLYTHGKCFFNSNYDYLYGHPKNRTMFHNLWTVSRGIPVPPVNIFDRTTVRGWHRGGRKIPIQLNHYAIKSFEEHREKDKKGDVYYSYPTHGDDVFYMRDRRCSVPDYHIFKYLAELKRRMEEREPEK
ncbi:MAG: glycosyltransferase family 92 protein [Eubacteriales bacterium]|nr:glycosyltransferase family 92 protein [Eubacteriales bacterium]